MDFIQVEIKRIHRNRMVLFGILALYFLIFIPVTAAGSHGLSYFALVSSPFLLVVVLFAFFFFSSMHSYRSYLKSKTYKNLAQLGMGSAESTGKVISDEVANKLVYLDKRLVMTQNWIVLRYVFTVTIKPLSELIWLYKRMTRTNFGGKFFSIICTFMNKKQYQINVKNENQCDELLMFIINKHPQILAGYSETWFRIYKKTSTNSFIWQNQRNPPTTMRYPTIHSNESKGAEKRPTGDCEITLWSVLNELFIDLGILTAAFPSYLNRIRIWFGAVRFITR